MEEVANEGLWPLEARKQKGNFLLEPPEEMQLCQFPDFRTSDPQTRKEINLENFKPLSLWHCVIMAATENQYEGPLLNLV